MSSTPPLEKVADIDALTKALTEEGFEVVRDPETGGISIPPEAVSKLTDMGLLTEEGAPDEIVNKEQLDRELDGDSVIEETYNISDFKESDIDSFSGDYVGEVVDEEYPDPHHKEEYIGPIKDLRGHTAKLRRNKDHGIVCIQLDAHKKLNNKALSLGWHEFPADQWTDSRELVDKWKDYPSNVRAVIRKIHKLPRLNAEGGAFQTHKESRRGTGGAFGGPGARRVREDHQRRHQHRQYLVNVVCTDETLNKSQAIKAPDRKRALAAARAGFVAAFPDAEIVSVSTHK